MSIREPDAPILANAEFSGAKATLISQELQYLAIILACKNTPASTFEHTDLALPDKSHVSTITNTSKGNKLPNRIVEIRQPDMQDISWQPSSNDRMWRNTRNFNYVHQTTYKRVIRSILHASPLGLHMAELLDTPAGEAFDMLGSWARQHTGVTFSTEATYENDGKGIACQFTTGTVTTLDESRVTHELEVTDSQRIGKAVVDRTIRIGSTQVAWYDEDTPGEHDVLDTYANAVLQSDDMTYDELSTLACHIKLDSAAICEYIQSNQNRFNAPNTSA